MKKIMKFILFTIFLVFSVSGLFSQTTEQTADILLKYTFSKDYTLDSSSMRFSLKDDILEYEYSNGGDCGDYWESGIAQINGNKIHFIRIKEYSEVATEKKEYDGTLLDFGQIPNVNYRYRLETPRDTLEGGEVKDGEEVLCDGQKCIKYSERIVLKNSAKRYTAPNFSADLFISNDVIGDTKLPNNYVVFPGMTKKAFGVIKNKVNGSGVKILETGEPEVIEDIYSFWVKVQIVSGTDRDGNSLKAGTCGWCFGGYLE